MILNESSSSSNQNNFVEFDIIDQNKFIYAFKKARGMFEDDDKDLDPMYRALIQGAIGNNNFSKIPTKSEISKQGNTFKIPPELVGIGIALAQQFGIRKKDK